MIMAMEERKSRLSAIRANVPGRCNKYGRLLASGALVLGLVLFAGCLGQDRVNHRPVIPPNGLAGPKSVVENAIGEFSCDAYDPDGDSLVYGWASSRGTFVEYDGNCAYWKADCPPGGAEITVTVTDLRGGWVKKTKGVSVHPLSDSASTR
jgi:hypothetical protein